MTDFANTRATVPERVLFRELDGESVLLNLDSEMYYGLDAVGTRIWTRVAESDSIQAALLQLQAEYDVAPDQLAADVHTLLDNLVQRGLLLLKPCG